MLPVWPVPLSIPQTFLFHLSSARSSLLIHVGLLPPFLDFLLRGMQRSWAWRKWCLNSDQHSWNPLPSRALTHGIPPSSSLKRPKSALLRSKVLILLIALLPPRRILNSTISQALQPSLPPTFTSSTSPSLFINTRSSRVPFLVGSSRFLSSKIMSKTFLWEFCCGMLYCNDVKHEDVVFSKIMSKAVLPKEQKFHLVMKKYIMRVLNCHWQKCDTL